MQASGLTLKELAEALDLSPRSLQRRRRSGRLARFESDRLYRLARIVALAQQSLGDRRSAARWLKRSNRALGGVSPIARSTRNWELARWKTSSDGSPTAESVDPDSFDQISRKSLSRAAQGLRPLSARRRRRLSIWRPLVKRRHSSRLRFRTSVAGHARIFCSPRRRRRARGPGSGHRRNPGRSAMRTASRRTLPSIWRRSPAPAELARIGDEFVQRA